MHVSVQELSPQDRPPRFPHVQRFIVFLVAYAFIRYGTADFLRIFVRPIFTGSAQLASLIASVLSVVVGFLAARLTRSWGPPLARGRLTRHGVIGGVALITVVYLLALVWTYLVDGPEEPLMAALFKGWTPRENAYAIVNLLVFGPIASQIVLTHLLFNALPWERSRKVAIYAAIATTVFYLHMEAQAEYVSSYLQTFAISLILIAARYFSRGLLLPVLLTSYSTVLVVSLDRLYYG